MKRLLFNPGELVSITTLVESERNLRDQLFFADAKIEIDSISSQSVFLHVTVIDQWSTVPIVSINRTGNQWGNGFGIRESNLLGTGQIISIYHYQDITTSGNILSYINPSYTNHRLKLAFQFIDNSTGYYSSASIHKPLLSKYDKNSFSFSYGVSQSSRLYNYDGNLLGDDNHFHIGETKSLLEFYDIFKKYLYMDYTHSYGFDLKIDIRFYGKFFEMKHDSTNVYLLNADNENYLPDELMIPLRNDVLLCMEFKLYKKEYYQTNNLTNFKWTENLNKIKLISFTK